LIACNLDFVAPPTDPGSSFAQITLLAEEEESLEISLQVKLSSWAESGLLEGTVLLNGVPLTLDSLTTAGAAIHGGHFSIPDPLEGGFTALLELREPGGNGSALLPVLLPILTRASSSTFFLGDGPDATFPFLISGLSGAERVAWTLEAVGGQGTTGGGNSLRILGSGTPSNPLRVPMEWLRAAFGGGEGVVDLSVLVSLNSEVRGAGISLNARIGTQWRVVP